MASTDLSKLKIDKTSASPAAHRRFSKKHYFFIGTFVLVLLALLVFTGVLAPSVKTEVTVVSQMYPSQSFTLLNASGYVVAQRKAAVAAKITGRLVELKVEEGNRIQKGQIIARLEADDTAAARNQAAATLEQAKAERVDAQLQFERAKELLKSEYVSKADFDTVEARYKKAVAGVAAANAALQAAQVSVDYSLIRAPFDAVVLTKNADIGDIVSPLSAAASAKAAVVTIADMGSLQVEVDVSESNIGKVKIGQPCEILLDALPDRRFRGEVHMIVPTADRTKASIMVKIRFEAIDPRVLPEMSAKVAFLERQVSAADETPRIVVRPSSVITKAEKKSVFVVREDRAVETPITIGQRVGDYLEVVSGLKAGEKIVAKPTGSVRDGVRIKAEEK
ncbi:MAG TPA: efflux RND transporter periplasmic adaptor subunit [Dissulfurispiraceae bacterium]|nr:efflux RND transporter periplasmic adaptor subunit [Dissulfurispiraceae bacterium]